MATKNLGRVTGLSAYEVWLAQGNKGTEQDFINSLKADVEVPTKTSELDNDSGFITDDDIPTKVSELENDSKYLTSYTETDPKYMADKPNIALKSEIPTKVSQLTNDSKYLTSYTETDPTVPAWAKATTKPSYTKSEVGLGNVDNVKQYSASNPPPYPVTSVNGKTGAITVSVPTKTSQLTNDSGFVTDISGKQDKLVSGTNIKTVNGTSLLGSGNIAISGGSAEDTVEIILPAQLMAVTGIEFNMYKKNFIHGAKTLENYDVICSIDWTSDTSVPTVYNYVEVLRFTATANVVGTWTMTITVKDFTSSKTLATKTVTLHVLNKKTFVNKKVIFMGDSLTASRALLYPAEIQHNLSGGGIISLGTKLGAKATNQIADTYGEGYNGAYTKKFLQNPTIEGSITNPFYNPSTQYFDMNYYMTNNGFDTVDCIMINLGANMLGNGNAVTELKELIRCIRLYSADVPIIVSMAVGISGQDGWRDNGSMTTLTMQRHWRNQLKSYISGFDNEQLSKVYLSTPYLAVDPDFDYPTDTTARSARDDTTIVRQSDGMHPGRKGTLKMADAYFGYLNYYLPETELQDFTVTFSGTDNVTISNASHTLSGNTATVKEGSTFSATITANSGYDIKSITVNGTATTLNNGVLSFKVTGNTTVAITTAVQTAGTKYTVTYADMSDFDVVSSSHTVSSNKATVEEGSTYTATLRGKPAVADGVYYRIQSVTVDGTPVTVTNGAFSFTVTKDVTIAVVVNYALPETANDSSPDTATVFKDEWINDKYISYSGGLTLTSSKTGCFITNLIPFTNGQVIKVKGVKYSTAEDTNRFRWGFFNADGSQDYGSYLTPLASESGNLFADGSKAPVSEDGTITIDTSLFKSTFKTNVFCRFSGYHSNGAENVIVTVE